MNETVQAILFDLAKIVIALTIAMGGVPILVLVERRVSAFIQLRLGPNRVGPFGILQPIADAIKLFFKEDCTPINANPVLFTAAPLLVLLPGAFAFSVIPFGDHVLGEKLVVADLGVAVVFMMAIVSIGVYGLAIGGWSSNNKYSLMGGLRSTAQMISYEIPMAVAILTVVLMNGTLSLTKIVEQQAAGNLTWNIFSPWGFVAFAIFYVSAFAENNRLPFDLPECEAELVGGYHTEYSSMRFALFFMGEYVAMVVMSALTVTLFFGGWHLPFITGPSMADRDFFGGLFTILVFGAKVGFLLFVYVWVRWTLPRFRYDQLMSLGWKVLIPLSLANFAAAGAWKVWMSG